MIAKSQRPPMTDEDRQKFASDLGNFILDHLPYSKTFVFPTLPAVPTYPEGATPDDRLQRLEETLDTVRADEPAVAIPSADYRTRREVDISGMYPDLTAEQPLAPALFVTNAELKAYDDEHGKKLLTWPMGGADHQITKAVRIWYTYTVPSHQDTDDQGTPVTVNGQPVMVPQKTYGTWLMIGYVGDGH